MPVEPPKLFKVICDDCKAEWHMTVSSCLGSNYTRTYTVSDRTFEENDWYAVYGNVYCPTCAPAHRLKDSSGNYRTWHASHRVVDTKQPDGGYRYQCEYCEVFMSDEAIQRACANVPPPAPRESISGGRAHWLDYAMDLGM